MPETQLNKTISTRQLTLYGIGTMIGAGIYVLVGKVAGNAGMMAPIAFLLAGTLAAFTAFSYAELSSRFPRSGGEVIFVQKAFGNKPFSDFVGMMIVMTGVVSAAAILKGFVGYLQIFVNIQQEWALVLTAILLFGVAIWGIGESMNLIGLITVFEIGGLIFVIVMGADSFGNLPEKLPEIIPDFSGAHWGMVLAGAFLAFFAFVGFEDLANVAEEVKDPKRSLPKAIIISLVVSTLLYVLVSLVAVLSLSPEVLRETEAPMAAILTKKGSSLPMVISAISMVAVINGALAQIIMSSRVIYGMADEGMVPSFFRTLLPGRRTPIYATLLVTVIILILALTVNIEPLAEVTTFVILSVFVLVNGALLKLKRDKNLPEGGINVPRIVPALGMVFSLFFLVYKVLVVVGVVVG